MTDGRAIDRLRQALRRLPGVGPKTAQRMAFHLLERDRDGARMLAEAVIDAVTAVNHCRRCNNFSESEVCTVCMSSKRDTEQLCVVETPADLETIEQSGAYSGLYFVLMGHLSPLDRIGPDEIAIERLMQIVEEYPVREIILATNLTMEGQATADYLADQFEVRDEIVTRLARGVPAGGELEYMDSNTLNQAFTDRRTIRQRDI